MIVSHSRQFIFLHIPKNAGKSIESILVPSTSEIDFLTDKHIYGSIIEQRQSNKSYRRINRGLINPWGPGHHSGIKDLQRARPWRYIRTPLGTVRDPIQRLHARLFPVYRESQQIIERYFTFAFVRNPWDRMVSIYHFFHQGGEVSAQQRTEFADFRSWLNNDDMIINPYFGPEIQRVLKTTPQAEWMKDENGTIAVDFIGRVERIDEDIQKLQEKIGLPRQSPPKMNPSNHSDYREYYDDETIDIVGKLFMDDIRLWNYTFK